MTKIKQAIKHLAVLLNTTAELISKNQYTHFIYKQTFLTLSITWEQNKHILLLPLAFSVTSSPWQLLFFPCLLSPPITLFLYLLLPSLSGLHHQHLTYQLFPSMSTNLTILASLWTQKERSNPRSRNTLHHTLQRMLIFHLQRRRRLWCFLCKKHYVYWLFSKQPHHQQTELRQHVEAILR